MYQRIGGGRARRVRVWRTGVGIFAAAAAIALILAWPNPAKSTAELGALNADQTYGEHIVTVLVSTAMRTM